MIKRALGNFALIAIISYIWLAPKILTSKIRSRMNLLLLSMILLGRQRAGSGSLRRVSMGICSSAYYVWQKSGQIRKQRWPRRRCPTPPASQQMLSSLPKSCWSCVNSRYFTAKLLFSSNMKKPTRRVRMHWWKSDFMVIPKKELKVLGNNWSLETTRLCSYTTEEKERTVSNGRWTPSVVWILPQAIMSLEYTLPQRWLAQKHTQKWVDWACEGRASTFLAQSRKPWRSSLSWTWR